MLKARLIPLFFDPGRDEQFDIQLAALRTLLADVAELLPPLALGAALPDEADAVIFPQLVGEAYRQLDHFKALDRPILIVTSEFGTMAMWDWEIASYLRAEGVTTIAPYRLEQTQTLCRALGVRRSLRQTTFLAYQDNPGAGFQPAIFKRFYWWEDECTQRMFDKFGITVERRSFKALGELAKAIPDAEADAVWEHWQLPVPGVEPRALRSALKLYLAIKAEIGDDPRIGGVGLNCLNESHFSDTTPCLAWNMLYTERKLIWGCEADTLSMLTKYILHHTLDVPIMMTNLYPFLMGMAALKHEKIDHFPAVSRNPDDYLLVAHCGYLGVLPTAFASEWSLRPRVLEITDPNATAIDARLPEGPITLAKLAPTMAALTVVEGELEGYAQYPGSDCLNGGVIHVANGRKMMQMLSSHHYLLMTGHVRDDIELIGQVFDLGVATA